MEKPSPQPISAGDLLSFTESDNPLSQAEREGLPPIQLKKHEKKLWWLLKNTEDNEMMLIVTSTEQWARTMQKQLSEEYQLEEIWMETFKDFFGEDDLEYNLAKSAAILAKCWHHGEQLSQIYQAHRQTISSSYSDDFPY